MAADHRLYLDHSAKNRAAGRSAGIRAVLERLVGWLQRRRQRLALAELDDRLLADIGVSRAAALEQSRRRL